MVLWTILGGLTALGLYKKLKKPSVPEIKTPPDILKEIALSKPPSAPGIVTPARAAIHGDLMNRCNDPNKLRNAAALFGHECLVGYSQALLQKASMIHDMMHGAKDIVERSRAGDQHAMAIAKGIGEQARAGNKRAQLSWILIEQYTKDNSPEKTVVTSQ